MAQTWGLVGWDCLLGFTWDAFFLSVCCLSGCFLALGLSVDLWDGLKVFGLSFKSFRVYLLQ